MERMTQVVTNDQYVSYKQSILAGGAPKYHEKNSEQGKLFVRERLALLFDDGVLTEDGDSQTC